MLVIAQNLMDLPVPEFRATTMTRKLNIWQTSEPKIYLKKKKKVNLKSGGNSIVCVENSNAKAQMKNYKKHSYQILKNISTQDQ